MTQALRWLRRIALGAGALVLLLATVGAVYQWVSVRNDDAHYPAPGRYVDVDGVRMHLDCRGAGRPRLLLEAGLMSGASTWMRVHDALARVTETCAYDRTGLGWSDPSDAPRTADAIAERLHGLTTAAQLEGPFVLVGMSAGGVYVREYYARHPQDVVGIVFVDSSHEQQLARLPGATRLRDGEPMLKVCAWLQPLGVVRASGALAAATTFENNDPAFGPVARAHDRAAMRATTERSHGCAAMRGELHGFIATLESGPRLRPLGDLPLLVLSQDPGRPLEPAQATDPAAAELERAQRKVWVTLQSELASASTRGVRQVVAGSGHLIQLDRRHHGVRRATARASRFSAGTGLVMHPTPRPRHDKRASLE